MGQQAAKRDDFIQAMRCVASSVCVVTTDGAAGRHGATVSAFCSVSADPPMVLVCLNAGSRIAQQVQENGVFRVNILPAGATGIADRFAGRHDSQVLDRFDGMPVSGSVPHLDGATSLMCTLSQAVPAGTHQVCIGVVNEVDQGADLPLTYLAGRYGQISCSESRS
ncbi:MAG: flavin reductase family protein [Kiloniellales bacterium]